MIPYKTYQWLINGGWVAQWYSARPKFINTQQQK